MQRAAITRAAAPTLSQLRVDAHAGLIRRLYVAFRLPFAIGSSVRSAGVRGPPRSSSRGRVLFRLDRLARSGIRDTFAVVEELRAAGGALVTSADGFDISGPAAEVVLAVMAWAPQMERLAINEPIAAARTRLGAEGRPWGRPSSVAPHDRERVLKLHGAGRSNCASPAPSREQPRCHGGARRGRRPRQADARRVPAPPRAVPGEAARCRPLQGDPP
jgi:hypothetical protein